MSARLAVLAILVLGLISGGAAWGSGQDWRGDIYAGTDGGAGFVFGAKPGWQDGYDGQSPVDIHGVPGVHLLYYRTWGGSPAFYYIDFESSIPPGGSKTWSDIYMWAQDYTPNLGNRVGITYTPDAPAPAGYWARLVLDYVPQSLNWTGPMEFVVGLDTNHDFNVPPLPVPITDNPYDPTQVTRMHLTAYAPVPEPSSLLALGMGGLSAVGFPWVRRRVRARE